VDKRVLCMLSPIKLGYVGVRILDRPDSWYEPDDDPYTVEELEMAEEDYLENEDGWADGLTFDDFLVKWIDWYRNRD